MGDPSLGAAERSLGGAQGRLCLAPAPGYTSLCPLQDSWERLLASSKYSEQESFTVVFQPFFYELALSPFLVSDRGREQPDLPLPAPTLAAAPAQMVFVGSALCSHRRQVMEYSLHLS